MPRLPRAGRRAALSLFACATPSAALAQDPAVALPELSVVGSATPTGPLPGEARGSLSVPSVDRQRAALY